MRLSIHPWVLQGFDSHPEPTWVVDTDKVVRAVNNAALSLYGYTRDEMIDKVLPTIPTGEATEVFERHFALVMAGNSLREVETHRRTKDGHIIPVVISADPIIIDGKVVGAVASINDITHRRLLEEQIIRAQKMAGIARLAGGVAHDFNNQLTVILGFTYWLMEKLGSANPAYDTLSEISKAAERASHITQQLLLFSRKSPKTEPKRIEINSVVGNLLKMLQRLIGEDIEMIFSPHPEPQMIQADAGQIEQIVTNLVINARDAMPQGGRIKISTGPGRPEFVRNGYGKTGYTSITISDTGTGMSDETKAHLYEPYYTTKQEGKGTGLGLSIVYSIVKYWHGEIEAESELGKGTTFKIFFPVLSGENKDNLTESDTPVPRGTETILVAEDNDAVLVFTEKVLADLGYNVLKAPGGFEAISIARGFKGTIDLLITDVVMPGMDGISLYNEIRKKNQAKVLFMSGYYEFQKLPRTAPFLQKPFTPRVLGETVRSVLDAK